MTGVFPPAVLSALQLNSGTAGPAVINSVAAAAAPADADSSAENDGVWEIPFNLQLGTIKYAPMQPFPPTAITATNTKPLNPTSSFQLAKTHLPPPLQVTTVTQSATYSHLNHANTVSF